MDKVNLAEAFGRFSDYWHPRIVGELNAQHIKLARFKDEFVWHQHEHEDEMFLVISGRMRLEFRTHQVNLSPGEFIIVPRQTEHRPVGLPEAEVMLFEPAGTENTGHREHPRHRNADKL